MMAEKGLASPQVNVVIGELGRSLTVSPDAGDRSWRDQHGGLVSALEGAPVHGGRGVPLHPAWGLVLTLVGALLAVIVVATR